MTQAYGPNAILTPANGLTLMRLFTTPVMLAMIIERRFDHPTFWLWFVLCCTDGVDGIVARRMGSTRSGAFLDPLADKFLVLGGMWALAVENAFWPAAVGIIAFREIAMSLYRSWLSRRGVSLPASKGAKVKSFVQQTSVGFAVMPWVGEELPWIGKGLLLAAVVLTVGTGLQYATAARRPVVASSHAE